MEKFLLVAAEQKQVFPDTDELKQLARTAGGICVGVKIFKLKRINPAYYIGRGQAEEVAELCEELNAKTVIFDFDLKPNQTRNLEEIIPAKIIDRTRLILDIFSKHAHSEDGKNQVELAQLEYLLPRLTGKGVFLMRQVGGIGVRGPGEKKLEYDRRRIEKRINVLKRKLKNLAKRRQIQRRKRLKSKIPIVAICGYTNAGKSTLFNALTKAQATAQDKLFQTLEPLTRKAKIFDKEVIFVDTVGFIKNLPPQLINAFHSTLEEIAPAGIVLVVLDISDPLWLLHREVVLKTLAELGFDKIPKIFVANKCDKLPQNFVIKNEKNFVYISALKKEGIEMLKSMLYEEIFEK